MICDAIAEVAAATGRAADAEVEISIPGGEALAAKTLNGRLGIVGGLSILGTTGIVVPYSCAAWIHSIHSGIDVARAAGLTHIAGATGASSEAGVQKLYELPEIALIDMGDFVGGMLKYLRRHPVPRVTIAGGIAKMTKLAQGFTDLHSKRGAVDLTELANMAAAAGGSATLCTRIIGSNTTARSFCARAGAKVSHSAIGWRRWRGTSSECSSPATTSMSRSLCSIARNNLVGARAVQGSIALTPRLHETCGDNRRRKVRCRGSRSAASARPTMISAVRSIFAAATFAAISRERAAQYALRQAKLPARRQRPDSRRRKTASAL